MTSSRDSECLQSVLSYTKTESSLGGRWAESRAQFLDVLSIGSSEREYVDLACLLVYDTEQGS